MSITIHDPRFARVAIGHARLEKLWTGCRWAEGPAYFPAGKYLIWSDIPNDRLLRYDETDGSVSVFMQPCNNQNGHSTDLMGRLVACEHRGRCVSRIDFDGARHVLASHFEGKRLNSPNDVVVKSDGSIWFTDPTYGIDMDYEGDRAESEMGGQSNVYRIDPHDHSVSCVITDRVRPNGLAFSPDESILYVADTGRTHRPDHPATIQAYPVNAGGRSVDAGRQWTFAVIEQGLFDGFRVDTEGRVWTSAGMGVNAYHPDGALGIRIEVGEIVGNVCFGGIKRNRLYICGQTSLYALFVNARGAA